MAGFDTTKNAEDEYEEGVFDLLNRQFKSGMGKVSQNVDTLAKNTNAASTTPQPEVYYQSPAEQGAPEASADITDQSAISTEEVDELSGGSKEVKVTTSRQGSMADVIKKQEAVDAQKKELLEATRADALTTQSNREADLEILRVKNDELAKAKEDERILTQIDIDEAKQHYETERAKVAKLKPEDFWANKDTDTKLKMGLAILLGAVGQGLSGAKTNAAVTAMNNTINRDLARQKGIIDLRIKALDRQKLSVKEKMTEQSRLLSSFDAKMAEGYTKMGNIFEQAKLKSKDAQFIAGLDKELGEIGQRIVDIDQNAQQNIKTNVATTGQAEANAEVDPMTGAYQQITQGRGMSDQPMNEVRGKSVKFLTSNKKVAQGLERMNQGLTRKEFAGLQNAMRRVIADASTEEISGVGNVAKAMALRFGGSAEEIFKHEMGEKGPKYWKLIMQFSDDEVRYVSGAAVKPIEFFRELEKYTPGIATSYEDSKFREGYVPLSSQNIRDKLKGHSILAQDSSLLYFQTERKKKKKKK